MLIHALTSAAIKSLLLISCVTAFAYPLSLALLLPPVGVGLEYAAATLSPGTVFSSPFVMISIISSQSAFDLDIAVASDNKLAVKVFVCPNAAMCCCFCAANVVESKLPLKYLSAALTDL